MSNKTIKTIASAAALMLALGGCGKAPAPDAGQAPAKPLDTSVQKPPVADPNQPVASGNTPAAADVAAVAALGAQFDPARDPANDLETAEVEAKRGGKRILLDVGGEWCSWCHILDAFIEGDAELRSFRDANYVWVKVNYSDDDKNEAFLAQYPKIESYPHLLVLDANGKLLHSQFTGELEKGEGYDRKKFFDFLKQWAPPKT
ncbi:thioredoxin family protein [Xanthomonas theicola]|uniref:Disulfide bond formation protein DsbD n=1 Tax=Xanthomonas theicola TaxID=56464 RepID=A0A2S6ZH91_9XANT|nr:thioredoxin family protein [Xanthomonas theicola]PPT91633.1 disulfide bond formation protein DsbD [Xanthomonas theicola]QNH26104.1 thioredoxin family protein [Xanthomonas theicola]